MSANRNPVFYEAPTGEFKQTLGYGIARYGLFGYITSDRVNSDLTPYVKSNLPPQLRNLTTTYASRKKILQKRTTKRNTIIRFFQIFPTAFQAIHRTGNIPFSLMNDVSSGKVAGQSELAQDSSWGISTVKTNSLQTDLLWSTTVNLGSTMQPLRINIDTGSADFIVFDPACDSCALKAHSAYVYAQSSTFNAGINITFSESYADGGVANGYLATDILNFGNGVQVPQTFGLATQVSTSWAAQGVDGLMGLGPDSLSSFPPPFNRGVFTQLLANQALLEPMISIALAKAAQDSSGEFSFGKIDDAWVRGGASQMLWKNVTSQNFWGTELTGIYVNNKNIMVADDPPRAIVDTGTSLLLVSASAAAAIHSQILGAVVDPSNGIWRLPCQTGSPINAANPKKSVANNVGSLFGNMVSPYANGNKPRHRRLARYLPQKLQATSALVPPTPPNIFIELGAGTPKFGIPASDLPYQGIPTNDTNSLASDGKTVMCYSGIQAGSDGFFVLGGTFIKNHYVTLRRDGLKKSMGFGNRTDVPVIN